MLEGRCVSFLRENPAQARANGFARNIGSVSRRATADVRYPMSRHRGHGAPAPVAKLGDVAAEYAVPALPTNAVTPVFIMPDVVAPPGSAPAAIEAASNANDTPLLFSASPKQNSDSYPLRGPLLGASPNAPTSNVVVHLSISVTLLAWARVLLSELLLIAHELPDNRENPQHRVQVGYSNWDDDESWNPFGRPWNEQD